MPHTQDTSLDEFDIVDKTIHSVEEGRYSTSPQTPDILPTSSEPAQVGAPETPSSTISMSGYLLLNIAFVVTVGTVKLVMALHGFSLVPTLLDWVVGVVFFLVSASL